MECFAAREMMSAYLEQYLSDAETCLLEQHVAGCPACRAELNDLRETLRVVHSLPRQEPAIDLWEQFAPEFEEICAELNPGPLGRSLSRP